MRVLHLGWGFSPWRPGGLIAYAEDLMEALVDRGHDVSYFFSGRHYARISGPRLKRWRRGGVAMHEVINSPIVFGMESGTRDPGRELSEPRMEAGFRRVLEDLTPDVLHVQELSGLPSSLLDVAAVAGVPTVMTLQDYFPLCATLRLFDADGRVCMRREIGADCVVRNADAPVDNQVYMDLTLRFEMDRLRRVLRLGPQFDLVLNPVVETVVHRLGGGSAAPASEAADRPSPPRLPPVDPAMAPAFQRRRDVNVERLSGIDRLIAQSARVAEIYATLGVRSDNMSTLPFTLRHIEHLRPRSLASPPSPVTFATLNGCASPTKGSELVVGALHKLRAAGLEGRFRLRVLGYVHRDAMPELLDYDGVELGGVYRREQIGGLLEDVDVGIMPSMWEEAFGYTGIELLAKGIPLIANPLGGIVEYAREGKTAWLNRSCSAEGLAELMAQLVHAPQRVVDMHHCVLAQRERIITPMAAHVDAIEATYRELAARPPSAGDAR